MAETTIQELIDQECLVNPIVKVIKMAEENGIDKVRSEISWCGVKFGLAVGEVSGCEDGRWRVSDSELFDMLREGQELCSKICNYIDLRREPRTKEDREYHERRLKGEI